jgi:hypothetical protein
MAVALMVAVLAGCAVPPELIRPQYAGGDAAVVKIYCSGAWMHEFYIEIDGEIAGVLAALGVTTIRTAPGAKSVIARNIDSRLNPLPIRIDFKPGEIHFLHVDLRYLWLITIEPVDEKTFMELAAKKPAAISK